jgi:hypothetical protein
MNIIIFFSAHKKEPQDFGKMWDPHRKHSEETLITVK